ncbi:MAG: nucleoside recognition domain-containing protein [Bacteroidales bacterium]|nr:nucleoside recognition domain-containing protein [Bacteroidales bacterium]
MPRLSFFNRRKSTHEYHNVVERIFGTFEKWVKHPLKFTTKRSFEAIVFLIIFFAFFGGLAYKMTLPKMLNTFMQTSYHLLLETVFYIMAICVLMGAISKMLTEFGVVRLLENLLRPLMKPLYNLPGVAALGAVMTFLSDNPAIITLAHDKNFNRYFKKYQLVSLTNFGTAFGMGLVVIAFMTGLGFGKGALIGLAGAIVGSIVSTRLMQRFTLKSYPELDEPVAEVTGDEQQITFKSEGSVFMRFLNSLLDGGKDGVGIGIAIIPGVLCISTIVMMLTFGPSGENGQYMGVAYEGVPVITWAADKINFIFKWLFGFESGALISFPMTALGAVGAAIGLVPRFIAEGIINTNAIAVFTAMGMCWSGFLSTHAAMLDSLGYRKLIGKAIGAHTIGGLCAGIAAHWLYVLLALI